MPLRPEPRRQKTRGCAGAWFEGRRSPPATCRAESASARLCIGKMPFADSLPGAAFALAMARTRGCGCSDSASRQKRRRCCWPPSQPRQVTAETAAGDSSRRSGRACRPKPGTDRAAAGQAGQAVPACAGLIAFHVLQVHIYAAHRNENDPLTFTYIYRGDRNAHFFHPGRRCRHARRRPKPTTAQSTM
jgi:hypothetical protein